jgi:hypothetical protein
MVLYAIEVDPKHEWEILVQCPRCNRLWTEPFVGELPPTWRDDFGDVPCMECDAKDAASLQAEAWLTGGCEGCKEREGCKFGEGGGGLITSLLTP